MKNVMKGLAGGAAIGALGLLGLQNKHKNTTPAPIVNPAPQKTTLPQSVAVPPVKPEPQQIKSTEPAPELAPKPLPTRIVERVPASRPPVKPEIKPPVVPPAQMAVDKNPIKDKIETGLINIDKIIRIESSGNPRAQHANGASGLMQVMPATWDDIVRKIGHGKDPDWQFNKAKFDKQKNVIVGSYYMNKEIPRMLRAYGIPDTVETRIACYNSGIGSLRSLMKKHGKDWIAHLPKETQDYIQKYKR